ncbi:uncharacterized protein N7469_011406 [Penicillium citrinum]|uniref:SAM-dependent MTase RsmB/NOP-type domain-containing protein n=2 Tax=Penicillium TaxID=5073 RepID=A0A9W9NDD5_PENCI|nr:uncharacterized protein N7469_011406 [Penicillium citrinum]KAJ5217781.1 hypothetical protein N7469_011406 [Penicillium citrinum]KAJ5575337.1 hypothetical protein N7450_009236 [Penicillium hetheringtonii]KAK5796572.1 hypothetical protein VI817_005857 [Penicillium citrinum]
MGKRGGKKFNRGGRGGGGGGRTNWSEITRSNEKLERYYNELGIVPEEEKEEFWAAIRRDLPNSFRFTGSRGHALAVQERLKQFYIPEITSIKYEGEFVEPPRPVEWYPDQLAWAMTTPKQVIRRFAPFSSFQKFLVAETEVGNISRQEVVSMIPPLLIDAHPGMTVLDMCAAPGSKSAQLMELLHAGEEDTILDAAQKVREGAAGEEPLGPEGLNDDGRTTGLLICNDSDYKRAHMLIHQMKRLSSPNLIVTNHDATMYPSIKLPPAPSAEGKPQMNRYLKFDRILADVPCSGDGTPRKNVSVWKDWNPANALGLYVTQARILVRALQMLKVGGRVVYSTCSLNPIENEAVIASAIERCGGSANVKILDCSKELPGLKRAPGMRDWKVMDREGRIWNSWKDVEEHKEKEGIDGLARIAKGMFAPESDVDLPLDRCMRVYPHHQDTGGFFITVLEKTQEIRAKPENVSDVIPKASVAALADELDSRKKSNSEPYQKLNSLDDLVAPDQEAAKEAAKNATVAEATHQPPYSTTLDAPQPGSPSKRAADDFESEIPAKKTKLENGEELLLGDRPIHKPAPAVETVETTETSGSNTPAQSAPLALEKPVKKKVHQEDPYKYLDPNHEELQPIYSFYELSERFPRDRFMVRNVEGNPTRTVYYTSSLARDILIQNEGSGMKFVHCGVKMFVKQDAQRENVCRWRIQTDGLRIIEPWVGSSRSVTLTKRETLRKLLVEMFPKVNDDGWKSLGEIGEQVKDIPMGCSILRVEPTGKEDGLTERMVLPLWRSLHSLNLMLPKEDRRAMLLRIFNDDTPLVNATQKKGNESPAVAAPVESTAAAEDQALKVENEQLGEVEQEHTDTRETYTKAGGEEDRFNTTV